MRRLKTTSPGLPAGFRYETASVGYGDPRTFWVGREAQGVYTPGSMVMVLQGGAWVPATVIRSAYVTGETRTYVTTTAKITSYITGAMFEARTDYAPGNDEQTVALYHMEDNALSAVLYDASLGGVNHSTDGTKMTQVGTAPALTATGPKFGTKCLNITANGGYVLPSPPFQNLSAYAWTVEMWIYGQPGEGHLLSRRHTGGPTQQTSLAIYNNRPTIYSNDETVGPTYELVGDVQLSASQWNHVAFTRDSARVNRVFTNGTLCGSSYLLAFLMDSYPMGLFNRALYSSLAYYASDLSPLTRIDEIRFSARCLYTASFTPPSLPFGPDAR